MEEFAGRYGTLYNAKKGFGFHSSFHVPLSSPWAHHEWLAERTLTLPHIDFYAEMHSLKVRGSPVMQCPRTMSVTAKVKRWPRENRVARSKVLFIKGSVIFSGLILIHSANTITTAEFLFFDVLPTLPQKNKTETYNAIRIA